MKNKKEQPRPVKSTKSRRSHLTGLIRKTTRQGKRSLSITIPSEIVDQLGIREKQKLVFKVDRKKIIISDWK